MVALFSLAWAFALLFIKMSILLLYRRIFAVKKFLLVTNIMGGFVFCWFLIVIFELAFVCRPYRLQLGQEYPGRKIRTTNQIMAIQWYPPRHRRYNDTYSAHANGLGVENQA